MKARTTMAACALAGCCVLTMTGCYEEVQQAPSPQAAQPAPTPGPITSHVNQGGGSALGGAKRSAENIVGQAEDASQRVADEADALSNPTSGDDD